METNLHDMFQTDIACECDEFGCDQDFSPDRKCAVILTQSDRFETETSGSSRQHKLMCYAGVHRD